MANLTKQKSANRRVICYIPLIFVLFVATMFISASQVYAEGDDAQDVQIFATGECGTDVKWELRASGDIESILYIYGQGDMYDYDTGKNSAPWLNVNRYFESVEISDGVTSIGDYAFENADALAHVSMPDSIKRIGEGAFCNCERLKSLDLPSELESISPYTFSYSSIEHIEIPADVSEIGRGAFVFCTNLRTVSFPNSLIKIDDESFMDCELLEEAILPEGTKSIGDNAFCNCPALSKVVIPNSVEYVGDPDWGGEVFGGCRSLKTCGPIGGDYDIQIGWERTIPASAFRGSCLESVIIPDTVTVIGNKSFLFCDSLSHLEIPAGVTQVGEEAFSGGTIASAGPEGSGADMEFGWAELPANAFGGAPVRNLILPDNMTTLENGILNSISNSVETIEFPASLKTIGDDVFLSFTNLNHVVLPDGLTSIGSNAFSDCYSLNDLTIPGSVTKVGKGAFSRCRLLSTAGPVGGDYNLKFGWSQSIPDWAFSNMCDNDNHGLRKVVLPAGLTSIGDMAFMNCSLLRSVDIPDGVEELGTALFSGCASLSSVIIPGSVTTMSYVSSDYGGTFDGCKNLTSAGPIGGGYNISYGWTEIIPDYAFSSAYFKKDSYLKKIVIKEGINYIGSCAFEACTKLTGIIIPDGVTTIEDYAFRECSNLSSVIIPGSVTQMSLNGVFVDCDKLETAGPVGSNCNIEFGWKEIIPEDAFYSCNSLREATIPESIYGIRAGAFYHCSNLEKVVIKNKTLLSIGYSSYVNTTPSIYKECNKLKTAGPIGSGCNIEFAWTTNIPGNAFRNCSSLVSVEIPDGIKEIEEDVFFGCSSLEKIKIPETVTFIGGTSNGKGPLNSCTKLKTAGPTGSGCNIEFGMTTGIPIAFFKDCTGLVSVDLPDTIETIGKYSFSGCISLKNVTLPDNLKAISSYTFYNCTSLEEVTIPIKTTSISEGAFTGCSSFTDVYYCGNEADWAEVDVSEYGNEPLLNATMHFIRKVSYFGVLKEGDGWYLNWTVTYIEKHDDTKEDVKLSLYTLGFGPADWTYTNSEIGDGNTMPWLSSEYGLTKDDFEYLSVSGNVYITPNQFEGYSNLRVVDLTDIYGISSSAFANCTNLRGVNVYGESLYTIDSAAFKNDSRLVTFGFDTTLSSLTNIGDEAFANTAISNIEFQDSLEKVGNSAFASSALDYAYLGKNVNSIGSGAFDNCDVTIGCYRKTYALKYAEKNNIPYILLGVPTIYNGGDPIVQLEEDSLEECVLSGSSTEYNPNLAYYLCAISRAAYNLSDMLKTFKSLEFDEVVYDYRDDYTTAYTIARKKLSNGSDFVLITIRGSYNLDWVTTADIGHPAFEGFGKHHGFETDAESAYKGLKQMLGDIPTSNVTYVITGHSQGAAAANLLSVKLHDEGVPTSALYNYNYACPNVACLINSDDWNPRGVNNNIYNIGNVEDFVTFIPSNTIHKIVPIIGLASTWGKFGRSKWFNPTSSAIVGHDLDYYLSYLKEKHGWDELMDFGDVLRDAHSIKTAFGFHCPVDVVIMDSSGTPVAGVTGEKPCYYDSDISEVLILVEEDEKWIFLPPDDDYKVMITGTGEGEMRYEVGTVNIAEQETIDYKVFDSVKVKENKEMTSEILQDSTPKDAKLYVMDESYEKAYEISEDGSEEPITEETCSHEWSEWTTTEEATCTVAGREERICSLCSETQERVIHALGHSYGEWIVTVEATETKDGEKTRICSVCGEHEKEIIPKNGGTTDPASGDSNQSVKPQNPSQGGSSSDDTARMTDLAKTKPGTVVNVEGATVQVLTNVSGADNSLPGTVAYIKGPNKKSVIVPAKVTINGKFFNVIEISSKAFTGKKIRTVTVGQNVQTIGKNALKGSKATKLVVKSMGLKKASVKGSLKGSKVKTVQVEVGKKAVNKKYVKKYKKIFTKKNAGKKVKVK